jgi:pilus assembly protein Flp/PilA
MSQLIARLHCAIVRFREDDEGATAVEYGLMVALIAAVIIGVVTTLGLNVQSTFSTVGTAIGGA